MPTTFENVQCHERAHLWFSQGRRSRGIQCLSERPPRCHAVTQSAWHKCARVAGLCRCAAAPYAPCSCEPWSHGALWQRAAWQQLVANVARVGQHPINHSTNQSISGSARSAAHQCKTNAEAQLAPAPPCRRSAAHGGQNSTAGCTRGPEGAECTPAPGIKKDAAYKKQWQLRPATDMSKQLRALLWVTMSNNGCKDGEGGVHNFADGSGATTAGIRTLHATAMAARRGM